ncbi:MAG: endonuclease III domain-containing protein [Anaeroplasmataceae bacterium]
MEHILIYDILKNYIKEYECELNYSNHFELLCAVMLSAQTTDKQVNKITIELFKKFPNPKK